MLFLPNHLLSVLIILPLTGVLFILQIPPQQYRNIRNCSLWISTFCFLVTLLLFFGFDPRVSEYQFVVESPWISLFNIHYQIGIDNFALFFLLIVTALMPIVILLASEQKKENFRSHMILMLCLESCLIGSFSALDIVLFYMFSEAAVFSFLFMANIWSGEDQKKSLYPFFITVAISSFVFLIFLLKLSDESSATTIQQFKYFAKSPTHNHVLCLAFVMALLLRNGVYPFLQWFRNACNGLTRSASFFFSVILTLNSLYYIIRFLPLVIEEHNIILNKFLVIMVVLVFISTVVSASWNYQSVSLHLAVPSLTQINACFVLLSLLVCDPLSQHGTVLLIMNYSFVTAGAFLLGLILEMRPIEFSSKAEKLAILFIGTFLFLSYMGVPGTLGFLGHALIFLGLLNQHATVAAFLQAGLLLLLLMVGVRWYYYMCYVKLWKKDQDALNGPLVEPQYRPILLPMIAILFILFVLVLLACHPQFVLDKVPPVVER